MSGIQNKQEFIDATDSIGGPAFPFVAPAQTDKATGAILSVDIFPGMTLRDYYAGQVLAGFMSAKPMHFNPADDAAYCYRVADAMIAARKAGA